MRTISDNTDAVAFGMFLFLIIIAVSVIAYTILLPVNEAGHDAFDSDYQDQYLTQEGKDTLEFYDIMFDHGAFIFIMLAGAVMVINRAIYQGGD